MRVRLALPFLLAFHLTAANSYLFTSFRGNGESGVYFALSADGRAFHPLNGNEPAVKPQHPGMLMRDPWIGKGPDGTWHMLWTWGWTKDTTGPLRIGHASSRNLVDWGPQQEIAVMQDQPEARNAWAPEAEWGAVRKEWVIFWATTIGGAKDYKHRLYATRTRDWTAFTKSELFFDPGFSSIDTTLVQDGDRWIMVFKDAREPPGKRLRLAFAKSPQGPWTGVTEPFSRDWIEGPSVAKIGNEWWIYFDSYRRPQHYGAIKTADWKQFTEVTDQVSFPSDHRHGTVVRITEAEAKALPK